MTPDLGVYARDVQQSIAVNIRNYMKSDGAAASNGNVNSMNMGLNGGATAANPLRTEPPLVLSPSARGRDAYRFLRPGEFTRDGACVCKYGGLGACWMVQEFREIHMGRIGKLM